MFPMAGCLARGPPSDCGSPYGSQRQTNRRPESWIPSQRQLRKYASLFLRTDANRDGLIEPYEAHSICSRSGLSDQVLKLAWQHADMDRDGRLTFREFVMLAHIITCCLAGMELPPLDEGAPPDLVATVARIIETPEELDAQRSRSPSSVRSSGSSSHSASPRTGFFSPGSQAITDIRRVEDLDPIGSPSSRYDRGMQRSNAQAITSRLDASPASEARSEDGSSPRFGHERRQGVSQPDLGLVRRQLLAIAETDRLLVQQFGREADQINSKARDAREACDNLETEMRRKRSEFARFAEMRHQLDRQVVYAKRRVSDLYGSRRKEAKDLYGSKYVNDVVQQELKFLQQIVAEEERMLNEMNTSNSTLEQSCKGLQSDVDELERRRREILDQTLAEADLLHHDQHRNWEIHGNTKRIRDAAVTEAPKAVTALPAQNVAGGSGAFASKPAASAPCSWASSLIVGGAVPAPLPSAQALDGGTRKASETLFGLLGVGAVGASRPMMAPHPGSGREGV